MIELGNRLEELGRQTDKVKAVMLTGGMDGAFIRHADLADLARAGAGKATPQELTAWERALSLLEEIPQPTFAAIDGTAWGGGNEIALRCTLRIASERGLSRAARRRAP